MKQMIPICLINLIPNDYNEQYHQEIHITNCEIIRKAGYRSVLHILKYLIPDLYSN